MGGQASRVVFHVLDNDEPNLSVGYGIRYANITAGAAHDRLYLQPSEDRYLASASGVFCG